MLFKEKLNLELKYFYSTKCTGFNFPLYADDQICKL